MQYDGLEILNPNSTDTLKIYRSEDGRIFRPSNAIIRSTLRTHSKEFLFEDIVDERVYLRKAEFHVSVSCWCSAQVRDYLELSERLQNEMTEQNSYLSDGHPWNFVFSHSEIKFVDFGSIRGGSAPNDYFWAERAEYAPLETFFFISYCGRLRRRLAENVHEPAPISSEEILSLGFQGWADKDCHTGFRERFTRLGGNQQGQRTGKWIGYREMARPHSDLVAEDPRCATLIEILNRDPTLRRVVDVGANDGLHSRLCAGFGRDVLAFEIEDASASELFAETKERKERITVACTTLQDYVYHLKFINPEFHPKTELCLLFAVFHHMVHDFGYNFHILFQELEMLGVRSVLLEFIDYGDIHLNRVENKKSWYSLAGLEDFIASHGGISTVYPPHEQGRQLVLIENVGQIYDELRHRSEPTATVEVSTEPGMIAEHEAALIRINELTSIVDAVKRYTLWRHIPIRLKSLIAGMLKK